MRVDVFWKIKSRSLRCKVFDLETSYLIKGKSSWISNKQAIYKKEPVSQDVIKKINQLENGSFFMFSRKISYQNDILRIVS